MAEPARAPNSGASDTAVQGRNDKVADTEIQGERAGERMRKEEGKRNEASSDREGRPSEFPASKAGLSPDKR